MIPLLALTTGALAAPRLIVSTEGHLWQEANAPRWREVAGPNSVRLEVDPARTAQVVDGFGGCFNEKGWESLQLLTPESRAKVLAELFDPEGGCRFNLGRMPMGANDYSLAWYSFDETPDDFGLRDFSIARDREHLIPYLKAALHHNPNLRVWASPWCPPSWMKRNGHYACQPAPVNDLRPEQAGQEMHTMFRMEPRVLEAYAGYFGKFLDAYRAEGVEVYAVHVQNEPNSAQNFPSCVWTPCDLGTFIAEYLGPLFKREGRATEIWLGTIERPQIERVACVLDRADARPFVKGVGFQWAGRGAIPEIHRRYPDLALMQTETECGDGSNDWAAAEHTWGLMKHYFENGAGAYMYWNLVLDETGNSRWGWRQNAMITIDTRTHEVRYNPEHALMKHFSHFVRSGAHKLTLGGPGAAQALGFVNPDGTVALVAANLSPQACALDVTAGGRSLPVELPPKSFATLSW